MTHRGLRLTETVIRKGAMGVCKKTRELRMLAKPGELSSFSEPQSEQIDSMPIKCQLTSKCMSQCMLHTHNIT